MVIRYCKVCGDELDDDLRKVYCSLECMEKEYSKDSFKLRIFHRYAANQIRNQIWDNLSDKEQHEEMMKFAKDYLGGKI